jgi:glycerol-3-phosphate acyltransferase PlsY
MNGLLAIAIAYLLGSIPVGYVLVRLTTGRDVRAVGSGNIGATNVARTTGALPGIITLVLDILKGFGAVWLAAYLTSDSPFWTSAAALAVIAGHAFPLFLKFQGGKAVASFIGAFLYLAPLALGAALVVFLAVVVGTRYVSAGSVIAAGTFPLGVWLISHPSSDLLLASIIAGAFIVYRHKGNLQRIRAGTEDPFRWTRAETRAE